MSLLRFDEVSLEFGDLKILSDAEFSIEPGERVCLIGRNGAGKSTTLKLITGELQPDRGEIVRLAGDVDAVADESVDDLIDAAAAGGSPAVFGEALDDLRAGTITGAAVLEI